MSGSTTSPPFGLARTFASRKALIFAPEITIGLTLTLGLQVSPIAVEDGGWVGAKAILTPGAHLGVCSIAGAGSVVSGKIPEFHIYAGNPACFVKLRTFKGGAASNFEKASDKESEAVRSEDDSTILCTRGNS